jgi:hypothetical protein
VYNEHVLRQLWTGGTGYNWLKHDRPQPPGSYHRPHWPYVAHPRRHITHDQSLVPEPSLDPQLPPNRYQILVLSDQNLFGATLAPNLKPGQPFSRACSQIFTICLQPGRTDR